MIWKLILEQLNLINRRLINIDTLLSIKCHSLLVCQFCLKQSETCDLLAVMLLKILILYFFIKGLRNFLLHMSKVRLFSECTITFLWCHLRCFGQWWHRLLKKYAILSLWFQTMLSKQKNFSSQVFRAWITYVTCMGNQFQVLMAHVSQRPLLHCPYLFNVLIHVW